MHQHGALRIGHRGLHIVRIGQVHIAKITRILRSAGVELVHQLLVNLHAGGTG